MLFFTMKTLETVDDVIDALGGPVEVAKKIGGRKRRAIWEWKRKGRMAASAYPAMVAMLGKLGMTAPPELWGIHIPEEAAE